jgi:predicted DNA-binding transcriptional regulator AlpA
MKRAILKIESSEPALAWIDEKRAANITGLAIQTLRNYRFKGVGPPYYKLGRSVRYRLSDILTYMELRRVEPSK